MLDLEHQPRWTRMDGRTFDTKDSLMSEVMMDDLPTSSDLSAFGPYMR